jgi:UPF0716 protein FxsA
MVLLVLLFILVPIAEIYVIIQVGQAIGPWWTIALLIADSILGSMLMRSQGKAAWRRFNAAIAEGRPPAREVLDGVLVIFGGAFLLTPGFISDIFGLIFLIPPTRALGAALHRAPGAAAHPGRPRRDVRHAARRGCRVGRPRVRRRGHRARGRSRPAGLP